MAFEPWDVQAYIHMHDRLIQALDDEEQAIKAQGLTAGQFLLLVVLGAYERMTGDGLNQQDWGELVNIVLLDNRYMPSERCPYSKREMVVDLMTE